jgi:parvulin-like peptidyl-prolyl isomerase
MRRLFALVLVLSACPGNRDPQLEPVVEIMSLEDDPIASITVRDYRRALARLRLEREGFEAGPLEPELQKHVLDQLVEQRLVGIEAERQGVRSSTVAIAREIAAMKRSLPANQFERFLVETYQTEKDLERSIAERLASAALLAREAKGQVSEEELKRAFEKLPEEKKVRPARVHALQIMTLTEDAAQAVLKKLRASKSADFAELARKHSVAPEAEQGGDLGWFEKGDMPAVFDQICFSLPPGQISHVVPSELGYHVFKVIEREEERPATFEEAKDALAADLLAERRREQERAYVESLLSRHRVVRHEKRIAEAIE